MKLRLSILLLIYSISSYSQCFDCGFNIGTHIDDIARDVDTTGDGIILTNLELATGVIRKYDFNCNLVWTILTEDLFNERTRTQRLTVDSVGNLYLTHYPGHSPNEGMSMSKLNPNGQLLWTKLIGINFIGSNILHHNDHIYLIGRFLNSLTIDNQISLSAVGIDYFIAKFDSDGNLIDATNFFENSEDELIESVIDNNGNIYVTGRSRTNTKTYAHLTKLNSNLDIIWHKDVSNDISNPQILYPSNLYYNQDNDKLYLWGSFRESINIDGTILTEETSNGYFISALCELDAQTGDVARINKYENVSSLYIPGVGGHSDTAGNTTGYMAHKNNELFVLTSFRGDFTIGNQTVTTNFTGNFYDEDLVLFKVSLTDFQSEFIFKTTGENNFTNPDITYVDGPGRILFHEEDLYITAWFSSSPITIQGTVIPNNSGNMDKDILFYKYQTDINSSSLMEVTNTCINDITQFNLIGTYDSIIWDFDDPTSGADNTSTLNNPSHIFTNIGTYNVTAEVTCGTEVEVLDLKVNITGIPQVNQVSNLYACEDNFDGKISSSFDTSLVENTLIGGQTGITIKYFDGNGAELPSPLPNPMANSLPGLETITARVAYNDNLTCFTEVYFDLIVNPIPEINPVDNIYVCDNDADGISEFDIRDVEDVLLNGQTGMIIEFFHEDGQQLPNPLPNSINNRVPTQETITVIVTDPNTNCSIDSTFDLLVHPLPEANHLEILYGCDDNDDGISEYFDTSNVISEVIGNQTNVTVSFFDVSGVELPSPLPNPYTNRIANEETITVRVNNTFTQCYGETSLVLKTATQPQINSPEPIYACDQGNGFTEFDLADIETKIIGTQTGLTIKYYNDDGEQLPSPLPDMFQNTEPWQQTIHVLVENELNDSCSSETSLDLIVQELPMVNLDSSYFLCNLEPFLPISVASGWDNYNWIYEDGSIISTTYEANLEDEGGYILIVGKTENGIHCEKEYEFDLVRSVPPEITDVVYQHLSNNNTIEIIASGDGDFEYSIDGVNFQNSNTFSHLLGGEYTAYVRDKKGCGEDFEEVTIIDYPKFFTPNYDGYNDNWHILGIGEYQNSIVLIYDRYGKLLKKLFSNDIGWDGTYNGAEMLSNDYWFKVDLGNGTVFSGHFTLKR